MRPGLLDDAHDDDLCSQILRRRCGLDLWELCELFAGVLRRRLAVVSPLGHVEPRVKRRRQCEGPEGEQGECDGSHQDELAAELHVAARSLRASVDAIAGAFADLAPEQSGRLDAFRKLASLADE